MKTKQEAFRKAEKFVSPSAIPAPVKSTLGKEAETRAAVPYVSLVTVTLGGQSTLLGLRSASSESREWH